MDVGRWTFFLATSLLVCGMACAPSETERGNRTANLDSSREPSCTTGLAALSSRHLPKPTTAAPAEPPPLVQGKRVALNPTKTLFFETLPNGKRRVLIQSEVCLREGVLEVFLCREMTKEHEAILHANLDARALHAALVAAGAKPGSTVRYQPKFQSPTGSRVKLWVQYQGKSKTVTRPAQEWVRDMKSRKALAHDWVFAGSHLYPDPDDPKKEPYYGANSGDVITVSNFPDSLLDLPINSPKDWATGRTFEAWTERIPPLKTPVLVILEPVVEKK